MPRTPHGWGIEVKPPKQPQSHEARVSGLPQLLSENSPNCSVRATGPCCPGNSPLLPPRIASFRCLLQH